MARIRTIKPEFWTHPIMGRLDDSSKSLAIALLNFSDDEGFFQADPNLVRSSCRPFDDDSTIIRRCLGTLIKSGWVEIKTHPTHGAIGRVVNFAEHQRIDRPKVSNLSSYFVDDESTIDRRLIDAGMEGKGMEGKGKGSGSRRKKDEHEPIPNNLLHVVSFLTSNWPKVSYGNRDDKRTVTSYSNEDLWAKVQSLAMKFGKIPGAILFCGVPYLRRMMKDAEDSGKFKYAKDMSNFWGVKDGNRSWEDVYNQGLADFNKFKGEEANV
jgi:hypothetical protein